MKSYKEWKINEDWDFKEYSVDKLLDLIINQLQDIQKQFKIPRPNRWGNRARAGLDEQSKISLLQQIYKRYGQAVEELFDRHNPERTSIRKPGWSNKLFDDLTKSGNKLFDDDFTKS